jgi:LPXTG-site transpeptidase (sortase) family protein
MSRHLSRSQKSSRRQGIILLVFGLFLLGLYSVWRFHQLRILSFDIKNYAQANLERKGEIPVYIKIYPVGVDIKIKEAGIVDGVWQVFPDSLSHLASSARIKEGGNIVIYGHNKDNILGPIRYLQEGAKIELKGEDGKSYYYEVTKTDTVDPANLGYIEPKKEEVLTLYTCTGFLDSKRFITVAKRLD